MLLTRFALLRISTRCSIRRRFASSKTCHDDVEAMERQYAMLRHQSGIIEGGMESERMLIAHPKVRWGRNANAPSEDESLKLEEATALVRTLPGFSVASCMIIGTDYTVRKKLIWGSGRLESLQEEQQKVGATAVFVNVDILSPVQQLALHHKLRVTIYDRYNLVLKIFKFYARTEEAKLQIALAEIPYIRARLKFSEQTRTSTNTLHIQDADASLQTAKADRFEVLRFREHSIRKKLREAVESKTRDLAERRILSNRKAQRAALIAIIGYTNAGKTTLIKALTGATNISGENRLFATLDTTLHRACLPSKAEVFLADTIGFIADLPISLLASFEATLRHARDADLLVHVEDIAHPNHAVQRRNVIETLHSLKMRPELIENMIHVANKSDKLQSPDRVQLKQRIDDEDNRVLVSCRTGEGLSTLITQIDQSVQTITGSRRRKMCLDADSPLIAYLYSESLVSEQPQPLDDGRLVFNVCLNDEQMARLEARMRKIKHAS